MAQRRPLASFSNLWFPPSYQGQQQQPGSALTTTTIEKKRIKIKRRITMTSSQASPSQTSQSQGQQETQQPQHQEQIIERKKITIKRKVVTTTQSQEKPSPSPQKMQEIHHDYAPPATMFYQPRSDYITPPPSCSRFFIENKYCFLRRHDNACIDPSTKKVIGFWNEQVGENCKLLPVETMNEEAEPSPVYEETENIVPSPQKQKRVTKPRFVSDAHRARVACEPVALLREKLALQFGIAKQRN